MGKWTRRTVIVSGALAGGALVVGVALRPGHRAPKLAGLVTEANETLLNAWVKIAPDNTVTAIAPHCEMGQGIHTSLAMMLADEMDARWDDVRMLEAPVHEEFANYALKRGNQLADIEVPGVLAGSVDGIYLRMAQSESMQITGGSLSTRATGLYGMRVAGAAARQMLLEAAAEKWQVPFAALTAKEGRVRHEASGREEPYAAFAAAAAARTPPYAPRLKEPSQFTIMGTSRPRMDVPAKTRGTAKFGIDAALPGMKFAAVRAAPVFGTAVKSVDAAVAERMPGVRKVVNLGGAVAVVADSWWQAQQALAKIDISYTDSPAANVDQDAVYAQFSRDMDAAAGGGRQKPDLRLGDAEAAFASAARVVEAEYRVPFLAHAPMEPINCTARIQDGTCEIWVGSQNPLGMRATVAQALGIPDARVVIHNQYLGGGFGGRYRRDYAVQAAKIAEQCGCPVKLVWSREEDLRQDTYRLAGISRFRGGLDSGGRPVAWINQYVSKNGPAEAPHFPYAIGNQLIHYIESPTHVPFGPWRSVDHSQHGFFTESFMDELAHAAGQDPYRYRRDLLADEPRALAVLDAAAAKAGWGQPLPPNRGRGIALKRCFGSFVAQVAEVEVRDGTLRVHRIVCAIDPGFAINPDGLVAQMESGIIYGLTAALYGEISIARGAVVQSNFHDYPMVRLADAPVIETEIINSGPRAGGAGEAGTPCVAPAVVNAIHAATGIRIRELPVAKHNLASQPLSGSSV